MTLRSRLWDQGSDAPLTEPPSGPSNNFQLSFCWMIYITVLKNKIIYLNVGQSKQYYFALQIDKQIDNRQSK